MMVVEYPNGIARLQEQWRNRVEEAEIYRVDKNADTLAAFSHALKVFTDLVLRGTIPQD
jgi:hypothetical protein